jgi:LPS sulfotransferase NodH
VEIVIAKHLAMMAPAAHPSARYRRPPAFDRAAIAGLVRYAEACEAGWREWFTAHSVEPYEITYEDLAKDLDAAVRDIAGFRDVSLPPGLGHLRPRLQRQADHHTEGFVRLFNRHASA